MAVIDKVRGIEVSISIHGKQAQEYEDPDEEVKGLLPPKTTVKYIESVSDTEFAINVSVLPAFKGYKRKPCDLLFRAKVDGKWGVSRFVKGAKESASLPRKSLLEGIYSDDATGKGTVNPFKFAAIEIVETTDRTKIENDKKDSVNLGEVTVHVFRVKVLRNTTSKPDFTKRGLLEIAEKAIKGRALTHGTALGAKKATRSLKTSSCKYLDKRDKPLASFVFRYRSREALKNLLILRRSPTPDPFDALSAEERECLARQAFQLKHGIKPDSGVKQEKAIKRERNESAIAVGEATPKKKLRKTSMLDPIDLTDD